MNGKMQGVTLVADWDPKPGFKLGAKDIEGRQTYLGSLVWRNPASRSASMTSHPRTQRKCCYEVKAVGICGSDVHMAQADKDGYIYYPG
jgi:scyllo-inosose 3-dehydrogenase